MFAVQIFRNGSALSAMSLLRIRLSFLSLVGREMLLRHGCRNGHCFRRRDEGLFAVIATRLKVVQASSEWLASLIPDPREPTEDDDDCGGAKSKSE